MDIIENLRQRLKKCDPEFIVELWGHYCFPTCEQCIEDILLCKQLDYDRLDDQIEQQEIIL